MKRKENAKNDKKTPKIISNDPFTTPNDPPVPNRAHTEMSAEENGKESKKTAE